ncbi:hypothetical protein NHX12_020024, partial [Muraenolepis orangiensis]
MSGKVFVAVLNLVLILARSTHTAHECTPCELRTCPADTKHPTHGCEGGRSSARDPCGCCAQCARLEWEPCGGQDWVLGYCALGLTCASFNVTGAAILPEIGVCKVLPEHPEAGLVDQRCPLMTGCDRAGAECVCDARHSCLGSFSFPDQESCMKSSKTAEGCVCESHSCQHHFSYVNRSQCQEAAAPAPPPPLATGQASHHQQRMVTARLAARQTHASVVVEASLSGDTGRQALRMAGPAPSLFCDPVLRCSGVTCPALPTPSCPEGSVLTKSYTPPAGCCPSLPPQCTCDLSTCHAPQCPAGQRPVVLGQASGLPGDCCDVFECQKVAPKCVHNGKDFSEGEVYRMDPCWLCQCRGGISFCSKAECAELDYVELLSMDSSKASCWVSNKLLGHEEQWKEDDCTFCQCVDGEPHCTAMACKQSCTNPVKIPGECCPFCE